MEITRTLERFAWQIEAKPEGGFIARCTDATVPPLEAENRIELQRKIRENIASHLATEFPGLNISLDKEDIRLPLLDPNDLASSAAATQSSEGGIKGAVENWLTKGAIAAIGSQLPPELMEKLKAQAHEGKLKFTVTTTSRGNGTNQIRTKVISFGDGKNQVQFSPDNKQPVGTLPPSGSLSTSLSNPQLDTPAPITPVSSSSSFLKFLLAALVLLGLAFVFAHLKK